MCKLLEGNLPEIVTGPRIEIPSQIVCQSYPTPTKLITFS